MYKIPCILKKEKNCNSSFDTAVCTDRIISYINFVHSSAVRVPCLELKKAIKDNLTTDVATYCREM